jgi:hypothetical protein
MELGIPYQLISPDGSRAVVGNADAAAFDPDFVGYLNPENGITGLLDGADVRESSTEVIEGDGATHGPFYLGRRSGTINGVLLPNSDIVAVNAAGAKLKRATRALLADGRILWTPSGESIQRMLRFRRQGRPDIGQGRRPKTFQVPLVSADPYVLSAAEASIVLTPGQAAGELGIANPILDPITSALNVTAQQFVVNQGDAPSWPRFRIDGPIVNPEILNQTSGRRVRLVYTLAAGEWLDVYSATGQILLGGSAERPGALDFPNSNWWQVLAGANDVRLIAASYSAPAQLTVFWRHAWE